VPPDQNFTRYAFSDSVRQLQERYGSRKSYQRMEHSGDRFVLTEKERAFISTRDSFYLATTGPDGWPYVQFRGGPPGFLKILDERTLGFADFRGNRQYISSGNLIDTAKASLILMDYPGQQRLKIWAEATLTFAEDDLGLIAELADSDYPAVVERAVIFRICAYDWNCPQHITPRYRADEINEDVCNLHPEILKSCCPDEIAEASD